MSSPIEIKGLPQLLRKLDRLEKVAAKKAMRKATRSGTKEILTAVRAEIPIDKGILKKDQTSKVFGRGLSMGGVVGADSAKLEADSSASNGKRPTNIDWLVEFGHITPDGIFVPPSGAMRRAAADAMPRAEKTFIKTLAEEIEKAA